MNQDQFMIDFHKKGTTVTVDANELQQVLRDKLETERKLEKAEKTITNLRRIQAGQGALISELKNDLTY